MGFISTHLFASEFSTAPYLFYWSETESRNNWRRQKLKNTLCSLFHTHKTEPDLKQTELLESKHVSINSGLSCHLRAFSRHKAKPEREDVCYVWIISTRQERKKAKERKKKIQRKTERKKEEKERKEENVKKSSSPFRYGTRYLLSSVTYYLLVPLVLSSTKSLLFL